MKKLLEHHFIVKGISMRNYFISFTVIWITFFIFTDARIMSQAEDKKVTIAVLDFTPISQITHEDAALLTEKFRHALIRMNRFQVVERTKMDDILKEQDFSMTDNCNTNECAIQVGQLLAAEKIVMGNIGKIGSTYSITIRTVDITTGKSENSVDYEHKGSADELLDIFRNMANELFNPASAINDKMLILNGPLSTGDVNECYALLGGIRDIREIQELSVQANKRKYRIVYQGGSLSVLRKHITDVFAKNDYDIALTRQDADVLEFDIARKFISLPHWPIKTVTGVFLVSIGTGIYGMIESKNAYQKFRDSKTVPDMNKYESRTRKYDNITIASGLTAGASVLFYYFYRQMYNKSLPAAVSLNVKDKRNISLSLSAEF